MHRYKVTNGSTLLWVTVMEGWVVAWRFHFCVCVHTYLYHKLNPGVCMPFAPNAHNSAALLQFFSLPVIKVPFSLPYPLCFPPNLYNTVLCFILFLTLQLKFGSYMNLIAVHAEASQVTFQGSPYHSVPTTFPIFPQQSIYICIYQIHSIFTGPLMFLIFISPTDSFKTTEGLLLIHRWFGLH